MDEFLQSLIRGLGTGSIYSLLALGFVIIYKSTQVISFAQPAFMLAGAVLVTYLVGPLGFYVAVPIAALATAALALGVERAAVRPMVGRPAFVVSCRNVTNGINSIFTANLIVPYNDVPFGSMHPGGMNAAFGDGSVRFLRQSLDIATYRALASKTGGEVISAEF